ncbi:MAG: hypothetical protein C4589_05055 [Peptococcaceae bacterium]|nr:MAG: hypothetical protein C4589_05055 [Peptococcaceae bacterium]
MRRIQVVVEEWQYQFLRNTAEREKKAVSAVLRQIISKQAGSKLPPEDPLLKAAGIAQISLRSEVSSETVDERIYRR